MAFSADAEALCRRRQPDGTEIARAGLGDEHLLRGKVSIVTTAVCRKEVAGSDLMGQD